MSFEKTLVKTTERAFKKECHWMFGAKGWYLASAGGFVYRQECGRRWIKTPKGFVEVFEKDLEK